MLYNFIIIIEDSFFFKIENKELLLFYNVLKDIQTNISMMLIIASFFFRYGSKSREYTSIRHENEGK